MNNLGASQESGQLIWSAKSSFPSYPKFSSQKNLYFWGVPFLSSFLSPVLRDQGEGQEKARKAVCEDVDIRKI